jgi:hypothetical protein
MECEPWVVHYDSVPYFWRADGYIPVYRLACGMYVWISMRRYREYQREVARDNPYINAGWWHQHKEAPVMSSLTVSEHARDVTCLGCLLVASRKEFG